MFGAIINHYDPDLCDFDSLDEDEPEENLTKILAIIEDNGIEFEYAVEDAGVDAQKTYNFLNVLLKVFEDVE